MEPGQTINVQIFIAMLKFAIKRCDEQIAAAKIEKVAANIKDQAVNQFLFQVGHEDIVPGTPEWDFQPNHEKETK